MAGLRGIEDAVGQREAAAQEIEDAAGWKAAARGHAAAIRRTPPAGGLAPALGLAAALALMAAAMIVPAAAGWDVHVMSFPPLHAEWAPRTGPGTLPALGARGPRRASSRSTLAQRLPWRWLLAAVFAAGLAWMLALALVDGTGGIGHILTTPHEYLRTAHGVEDIPEMLREYVSRIP